LRQKKETTLSYRYTPYNRLLNEKPEVLRDLLLGTYMELNGNLEKVWEHLNLSSFSYYRYIRTLGLKETLASLRSHLRRVA
jgi:hypothetical protein